MGTEARRCVREGRGRNDWKPQHSSVTTTRMSRTKCSEQASIKNESKRDQEECDIDRKRSIDGMAM